MTSQLTPGAPTDPDRPGTTGQSFPPRHLVYVAGAPAVGKSTLMAHLTRRLDRRATLAPFPHDLLYRHDPDPVHTELVGVEIGRRRDRFAGTDALALNISPKVTGWIRSTTYPLILGEGDRLAHLGFLAAAHMAGYEVHLIVLRAPRGVLDARSRERGSAGQDPGWRDGRATKVERLAEYAEHAGHHVINLDGTDPPDVLALHATGRIPAITRLTGRLPQDQP